METMSGDRKGELADIKISEEESYPKIVNFLLFQIGWFACVYAAGHSLPILAFTSSLTIIVAHLMLTSFKRGELLLILFSGCLGLVVDSVAIANQVFSVNDSHGLFLAPLWLISLWMLFAICLRHSMSWMRGKYVLSAICGALFAPLAYLGGAKLGAIEFDTSHVVASSIYIGIVWSLVTPTLCWFVERMEKQS